MQKETECTHQQLYAVVRIAVPIDHSSASAIDDVHKKLTSEGMIIDTSNGFEITEEPFV